MSALAPHIVGGDDLLELLNVKLPPPAVKEVSCGTKPPKAKARFTEWSNLESFVFTGYVALIVETTCEMCGLTQESLDGIFTEEIKEKNGGRRLTALPKGGQWPVGEEHRFEVEYRFTPVCAKCVKELGFSKMAEAPAGLRTLVVRG